MIQHFLMNCQCFKIGRLTINLGYRRCLSLLYRMIFSCLHLIRVRSEEFSGGGKGVANLQERSVCFGFIKNVMQ